MVQPTCIRSSEPNERTGATWAGLVRELLTEPRVKRSIGIGLGSSVDSCKKAFVGMFPKPQSAGSAINSTASYSSLAVSRQREYELHVPLPKQRPCDIFLDGFGLSVDTLEAGL
ncbi:hypothetical protein GW17_00056369 [Ensete ventricosum]|nr:hypothetical protein GW17_00056369 [Ensete ventricosum]